MAQFKTGEVDWDSTDVQVQKGGLNGEGLFLNMKEAGDYSMRVISKPYQYYAHWVKDAEGKNRKVNCTLENCPVCVDENKGPQARWLLLVLHRNVDKGNEVKILDCSTQIFGQLKALKNHEKWGDLRTYDVTVTRGRKGQNPLYNVNATPKEDLSADEKNLLKQYMKEDSDKYIDLIGLCKPWSIDRLDQVLSGKTEEKKSEAVGETVVNAASDDEDFFDL